MMNEYKKKELLAEELLPHRERLLNFILSKVSDRELAEDILQDSILKALNALPDLEDEKKILSWFYQIVRNKIIDHYRRTKTQSKHYEKFVRDASSFYESSEDEKMVCKCYREILPKLKPEYSQLIKQMELGEGDPHEVAKELGITRNNLKVRRHRARQQLHDQLEQTCGKCAAKGCVDCECE
ncbi:RNA polymerase sigma factor [Rhodohalobacter sp. 614A]|uniref:RNA polymerase sigma factor n=1 Tax=Rhodohalobacter sp. 614A TaxID=2908649 RepID=UPI001F45E488|nr:sigma-70 family RNA polymerase sigma factor [Rhodohalobacter sp. 614A]